MMPQRTTERPAKCPDKAIGLKLGQSGPGAQPPFLAGAGNRRQIHPRAVRASRPLDLAHALAPAQALADDAFEIGGAERLLQEEAGGRPHKVAPQEIGAEKAQAVLAARPLRCRANLLPQRGVEIGQPFAMALPSVVRSGVTAAIF